tara:strand:- start:952 stop:1185 length:234 start_codon:yes stop_codon:yes gene_type:complete
MKNNIKLDKIHKVFKKVFPTSKIKKNINSLKFGDIKKWDSLGNLNLLLEIEKEFNIRFDTNTFSKIKSVKDIIREIK